MYSDVVKKGLEKQEAKLDTPKIMNDFMRIATLQAIDDAWVEQVDYLQQLQSAVSGRTTAQRNPVYEYQEEALVSFREMVNTIKKNIIRNILLSEVQMSEKQKLQILYP